MISSNATAVMVHVTATAFGSDTTANKGGAIPYAEPIPETNDLCKVILACLTAETV
jgi:hypothetical protein